MHTILLPFFKCISQVLTTMYAILSKVEFPRLSSIHPDVIPTILDSALKWALG